jgi:hypothetical protein
MRKLGEEAIENIALGAALLGTGGGGDPHLGKLMALQAVKKFGPVRLLDPSEVDDDMLVVPSAMMGAPSVLVEKIPNGGEFRRCFDAISRYLGKTVAATMPIEAGGINSMIPLAVAAQMDLPIIDADGMGRAFPELQMVTYHLDGITASPMVITDEKGNMEVLETVSNKWAEDLARVATITMGGSVIINIYSMTGAQVKKSAVTRILTYSEKLGAIIRKSVQTGCNPIDELLEVTKGYLLFKGKITDVLRETRAGFNFGKAVMQGVEEYGDAAFEMEFQNENLIGRRDGQVVASVPDLICCVDLESSIPITTEALKYGRRVAVLGLPCDPKWRTPKGIETVGPRYFKYDIDYVPIEERMKGVAAK